MNEILTDRERKNLAILDVIRRQGPIAKTEISKITELNIVTVSNYVDAYIKNGLVMEKGYDISSGGRRPLLVELSEKSGYVIGVGLTLFHEIAIVCDLKGEVVYEIKTDRTAHKDQSLVDSLLEITEKAISSASGGKGGVDKSKIMGIVAAVPGVVDPQARTIRMPGALGTQDVFVNVSLKDMFEEKFNVRTIIENDADAAVFGEKWFSLRQDIRNVLYMYSGVGCGMIINGQIYHGSTGSAGELGIFNAAEGTQKDWEEESTRLGRWGIELGTVAIARGLFEKGTPSRIFELAENDPKKISFAAIVRAAKEDDSLAVTILEDAGAKLGRKVAFLVNLLNPEVVVIGGGVEQAGPVLLDMVKRTVKAWAIDEATNGLKIVPAQLGEKTVPQGAAGIGIQDIFARA